MAGSQREVTVHWPGQLSMKDDFLVVESAWAGNESEREGDF